MNPPLRTTTTPRRRGVAVAIAVVTATTLLAAAPGVPASAVRAEETAKSAVRAEETAKSAVRAEGAAKSAVRAEGAAAPVAEIRGADGPSVVPGSFVVVLRDSAVGGRAGTRQAAVATLANEVGDRFGVRPDQVWGDALNGFSVRTSEAVARRIAAHPAVASVERDQAVRLATTTQPNAPWNLDRLDAPTGLSATYTYTSEGYPVRAYVIDSGIRITHQEFGGQAFHGYDGTDGALPADDCTGHGTHAAGTIGGTTYGVAKNVVLVAVKVFGCTGGTISGIIGGINWVVADDQPWDPPAVAYLGLVGGGNTALNNAVAGLVAAGIPVAVAAGNSNADACSFSPASAPAALTVGATQPNDSRASFSNWGTCLDIFAPGTNVVSGGHTSDTAVLSQSGTSQAAAHVAGMAARVLGNNPTWTPSQVQSYLTGVANPVVSNPGAGSPNRLLHLSPLL